MNQTSFQTPGAPPMMPQNVQLQQQIYQFLQSQPTLPGWQTVFPIERRASNIHQMYLATPFHCRLLRTLYADEDSPVPLNYVWFRLLI